MNAGPSENPFTCHRIAREDGIVISEVLLVRRALGQAQPEDCVQWAVGRLEAGADTPNLRILAGLNSRWDREEIERYLALARAELGVEPFEASTQPFVGAALVRSAFEQRQASAAEAVGWMAGLYLASEPRELLLLPWLGLRDDLDPEEPERAPAPEAIEAAVRMEWELLERARALRLPDHWLYHAWCLACGHVGELDLSACRPGDEILQLPGRRGVAASAVCAHCGSHQHRWLSDRDARSAYLQQVEQEQE
jgi:hypothetical protein